MLTYQGQNVIPVKGSLPGYLDLVPTSGGFNHIAFFSPLNSSEPIWITFGDWEVTQIAGHDVQKNTM
jgi:dipeptidyl aminopeptidase